MVRASAKANVLRAIAVIFLALLLVIPQGLASVVTDPEPPLRSELSSEERSEFIDYWLDVFARGTRSINDTPESYPYDDGLKHSLAQDLINALKAENEEIAAQFDPVTAGPMLGLSAAESPLVGFDGEPVTQAQVDAIYLGFIGGLVFDRENFLLQLEAMLDPITPDESDFPAPPTDGEVQARDAIREELDAEPFLYWDNDLEDPVMPEGFVTDLPEMLDTPTLEVPEDLSATFETSPFRAATAESWLDPEFHLSLPQLLAFLQTLTDLDPATLLGQLGLLADTAGQIVTTLEGPLSEFPQLAAPVSGVHLASNAVADALVALNAPPAIRMDMRAAGGEELPPEVEEAVGRAIILASSAQYTAIINGRTVEATWDAPVPVDLDDDGVADVIISLQLAPVATGLPEPSAESQPVFTLERVDPAATVARALDAASVSVTLPGSGLTDLSLTVAYLIPDTETTIAYVANAVGGFDHLEVRLLSASPSVELTTAGAMGAFSFAAARIDADDLHYVTADGALAPAHLVLTSAVDATAGMATLGADPSPSLALRTAAVHTSATQRLVLTAESAALPRFQATSEGGAFTLDAPAGSSVTLGRQDGAPASPSTFTARVLDVQDARAHLEATLAATGFQVDATASGADVELILGNVDEGTFTSASWAQIVDAGKHVTVNLPGDGIAFTSDKEVTSVRAIVATTSAAALLGPVPTGVLAVRDDRLAFSLDAVRTASVLPTGNGFAIDVKSTSGAPFLLDIIDHGNADQYLLSNLPNQVSIGVGETGFQLGTSHPVASIAGYLSHLNGRGANPTVTALALTDVTGTAAISMDGPSINTYTTGAVGSMDVLSSNLFDLNGPVFAGLNGNHALAQVNGLVEQHSASLTNALGSFQANLAGPLSTLTLDMNIDGPFCQSFGAGGTQLVFCLSNVPSVIDLTLQALPTPTITYDASDIIHEMSLQMIATSVDALFAIREIPKHIELNLAPGGITLSTDTRLGSVSLAATLGTTTLAAGLESLPTTMTLAWNAAGMTPTLPAGDAIGRAYVFLSTPGLTFNVDIHHLPPSVISWSNSGVSLGPVGDRIGSVQIQLAVSDLQFTLLAEGVPGLTASWNTAGGTLSTTGTLDSFTTSLVKGLPWAPQLSLYASLVGVPQLTGSWGTGNIALGLSGAAKITSATFQFIAGDLVLYLGATGIPSTTFTTSGETFNLNAPLGVNSLTAILRKGSSYYSPYTATDFVGLYMRPETAQFGISARFTGVKSISSYRNAWSGERVLQLGFTDDKTVRAIADISTSALVVYADMTLTNLAATSTLTFRQEGVTLSSNHGGRTGGTPWMQAVLQIGSPAAYAQMPAPRWPWETTGDWKGIMGNTMLDTTQPGVNIATKWRIYSPLPDVLSIAKTTSNGIPSFSLSTGQSLGKLDVRTNVKVNLNLCGGCTPYNLNTMVVAAVSNLPSSLSLSQSLGSGSNAGSPSFGIASNTGIQNIFLGVRFDNAWYPSATSTGGFPIWATVSDIPTSVSLTISKNGGWSAGNTPKLQYSANSNSLDASLFLDIGSLWTQFGKTTIINAHNAGRAVPGWLYGLAQYDATGHLLLQLVNVPAAGINIYRSGQTLVVDPLGSTPLTKFFADFNLRLEKNMGDSGCWLCGAIRLDWWWNFGYWFEIQELSLLLENLKYVSLDPGIESIVVLDGHMVFSFRAGVGIYFGAGVQLSLNVLGLTFNILCVCVPPVSLSAYIDPGFISFQVVSHTWSINYWTWAYPCHLSWSGASWCHDHEQVGVNYKTPDNWQWDAPIAYPPYVPFRGLNLNTGTTHVIMNPRILNCSGDFCWEVGRLVPVSLVMAYAYLKYFEISGVNWWSTHHHH